MASTAGAATLFGGDSGAAGSGVVYDAARQPAAGWSAGGSGRGLRNDGWRGRCWQGCWITRESLLRVPARIGVPVHMSRMPKELETPEYSVAVGMLLYTHRTQIRRAGETTGLKEKLKSIFAGSF